VRTELKEFTKEEEKRKFGLEKEKEEKKGSFDTTH
jgi:hypothetical protein